MTTGRGRSSLEFPGRREDRGEGGFSLVEVLCAIAILAVGLLGLTEAITMALRSTKESELHTAAVFYAAGLIEELRAEGYYVDGETEGEVGWERVPCRWRRTLAATEVAGLHEVTVVIEQEKGGKQVFELKTLVFEPELDSGLSESSGQRERDRERDRRDRRSGDSTR